MSVFDISSTIIDVVNFLHPEKIVQEVIGPLTSGGGGYLPMTRYHDDQDEETLTEMLMWELEGQMKRKRQEKRDQSASSSSVNYSWLEGDREMSIPRRVKVDLECLCRKIKPTNSNAVLKRFRNILQGISVQDPEELPLIFSSVLRTVGLVSEQIEEENKRIAENASGLAGRVWQRLQRNNKVGAALRSDIESGHAEYENDIPSTSNQRWAFTSTRRPSTPTGQEASQGLAATFALQQQETSGATGSLGASGVYRSASGSAVQYSDGMELTDLDVVNL